MCVQYRIKKKLRFVIDLSLLSNWMRLVLMFRLFLYSMNQIILSFFKSDVNLHGLR